MDKQIVAFIEWIYQDGNWYYRGGLWFREGYAERTTEQLYEYFLKYHNPKATKNCSMPDVMESVFCECETPLLVAEDTQLAEECFRCFKKIKQKTV